MDFAPDSGRRVWTSAYGTSLITVGTSRQRRPTGAEHSSLLSNVRPLYFNSQATTTVCECVRRISLFTLLASHDGRPFVLNVPVILNLTVAHAKAPTGRRTQSTGVGWAAGQLKLVTDGKAQ